MAKKKSAKAASAKPKLGDAVAHDGTWPGHEDEYGPYVVTAINDAAHEQKITFANDRYTVTGSLREMQRCMVPGIKAWFLEGRLFSAEQRRAIRIIWDWPADKALPYTDAELMAKLVEQNQLERVDRIADDLFLAMEQRRGAERVQKLIDEGHAREDIAAAAKSLDIDLTRLHGREQRHIREHLATAGGE